MSSRNTAPMPVEELARLLINEQDEAQRRQLWRDHNITIEVVEALKAEVDRFKAADSLKALLAGERALELSAELDDPSARPLGLWAYALGLTVENQLPKAAEAFEETRALYHQLGDEANAARAGLRHIQAVAMMGNYEQALDIGQKILKTFNDLGLNEEAGNCYTNIGIIYRRLGQLYNAEEVLLKALYTYEKIGHRFGIANSYHNLGNIYKDQDRFHEALACFQKALPSLLDLEQTQTAASTLVVMALLYRKEGKLNASLGHLSRAKTLFDQLGTVADAAVASLEEARVRLDLNLLSEAKAISEEVITIFEAREMHLEQVETLEVLGLARARSNESQAALEALSLAKQGLLDIGNTLQAARVDLNIATLYLQDKEDPNALSKALEISHLAYETLKRHQIPSGQSLAALLLAEGYLEQGNTREAKKWLDSAHRLALKLGVPDLLIRTERFLGQYALQENNLQVAEGHFKQAIHHLEDVRASLQVDEFKAAYLDDKTAVYGDLVRLLLKQQRAKEAWQFTERAKSRALLDLLGSSVDKRASSDDPELEGLRQQLDQAREALNRDFLAAEKEEARGELWRKLKQSEQKVTELIQTLQRLEPEAASLEHVTVPDVQSLLSVIESDTTLVEFFSTGEDISAFIISGGQVRAVSNLGTMSEISRHRERLIFLFDRVARGGMYLKVYGGEVGLLNQVNAHLKVLYELLIAPLELEDSAKLIVLPHGNLSAIPFSALFNGQEYLMDKYQISYAPSAAIFYHCVKRPRSRAKGLAAFGVPVDDIPRVKEEIAIISEMAETANAYLGQDANLETFFQRAPEANVLHLATHGAYRPDNPMFSGLRLGNGWLSTRDLYNLRLKSSLVVLSACESGLAQDAGGDEQFGLARGFLYAGTPTLAVSLWPVKDDPTSIMMTDLYQNLTEGHRIGRALHLAKLKLRMAYPNPYYWAAFSIIGDPNRKVQL